MAREPYQAYGDVAPTTEAPQDLQRLDVPANAFGAPVAQGAEQAGAGAVDAAKFYGQVAADGAITNVLEQKQKLFYGDLSKPAVNPSGEPILGPDGTPVGLGGFYSLRGADALSAAPTVQKQLDDFISQQRASLRTPQAQYQFDVGSRRYRAQELERMGQFADDQYRTWATDINDKGIALTQNEIATHLADPVALAQDRQALRGYYVKNDTLKFGHTETVAQAAVLRADQEFATTQWRASIVNDPLNAQKVLDQNKNVLGSLPNYDQMARTTKDAVVNAEFAPAVESFTASAVANVMPQVGAPLPGAPSPRDVSAAIGAQEWRGKGPAPTSINGAVGPSQIKPDTAREYGLDPTKLDDPTYAAHARDTIVSKIAALPNVQGDPARIAVGYFSGAGNIAPAGSPTPYIHDYADGNGKKTSAYVSDVVGRLQHYPSTADALNANTDQILQRADQFAEQKWPNYPDVQERFHQSVDRRLNQTISQQHQQAEVDAHVVQDTIVRTHAISEEQLLAGGPEVASAWQRLQMSNPYAVMGANNWFTANSRGQARTYGADASTYVDRVLAPASDPARIGRPDQLALYLGPGDDAALTNTGAVGLGTLMQVRQGPGGEAFATQAKTFFDAVHGNMTFSAPGIRDDKGEQFYSKFLAVAVPALIQAQKAGTLAEVLNPKSKDYIGNLALPFMRTSAQIIHDRLAAAGQSEKIFNQYGSAGLNPESLKLAVASGAIPREEGVQIARWMGYIGGSQPPASPSKPGAPQASAVAKLSAQPPPLPETQEQLVHR